MNPTEMPIIWGIVRRNPKFAPDAISIRLLGPGVAELTNAKTASAVSVSKFMPSVWGNLLEKETTGLELIVSDIETVRIQPEVLAWGGGRKQTVSIVCLALGFFEWAECGNNLSKRWREMSLVNYVLIGLLGTILAIALYSAKMDMSRSGAVITIPAIALT